MTASISLNQLKTKGCPLGPPLIRITEFLKRGCELRVIDHRDEELTLVCGRTKEIDEIAKGHFYRTAQGEDIRTFLLAAHDEDPNNFCVKLLREIYEAIYQPSNCELPFGIHDKIPEILKYLNVEDLISFGLTAQKYLPWAAAQIQKNAPKDFPGDLEPLQIICKAIGMIVGRESLNGSETLRVGIRNSGIPPDYRLFGLKDLVKQTETINTIVCLILENPAKNGNMRIHTTIGRLANLSKLHCPGQRLTYITSQLGNCTRLETLNIHHNLLKELPETLDQCKELSGLDISNNRFTVFPPVIGNLQNLRYLEINDNQLETLPEELAKPGLDRLFAQGNRLKELPSTIGNWKDLKKLSLSRNRIEQIPLGIQFCKQLTYLDLTGNRLKKLPPVIRFCVALEVILLSENHLKELPDLSNCKLDRVVVRTNQLESFPTWLLTCEKLNVLCLDKNFIESIPPEIQNCTTPRSLSIGDNPLDDNSKSLVGQLFDYSGKRIKN